MAVETLQIVKRDYKGRYTTVLDLNDGATNTVKDGGVTFTAPASTPLLVNSVDSDGADSTGKQVGNGQVSVSLYTRGTTTDMLAANIAAIVTTAYPPLGVTYFLKWKPYTVSLPVYYEIVAPSAHDVPYQWREFASLRATVTVAFAVKPYALGDNTSTFEDFGPTATLTDYTMTGGADMSISGGSLLLNANVTTAHRLWHTVKGYTFADGMITAIAKNIGYVFASFTLSVSARRNVAGDSWIEAALTNDTLVIRKTVNTGGAYTVLATIPCALHSPLAYEYAAVRLYFDGRQLRAEGGMITNPAPTLAAPLGATVSYQLTVAEYALFTTGVMGIGHWQPGVVNNSVAELWMEPYSYRAVAPDYRALTVPGDLDATADTILTHSAATGTAAYKPGWGFLAWYQQQAQYTLGSNLLSNWSIDTDTAGWGSTNQSGFGYGLGAVLTVDATHINVQGPNALKAVGPALANWGLDFQVFKHQKFKQGVTYTFNANVWGTAATGTVQPRFGTTSDNATGTAVTSNGAFQTLTVSWTPLADSSQVWVALINSNASTTVWVDAANVMDSSTTSGNTYPEPIIPLGEIPAGLMATQYGPSSPVTPPGAQLCVGWSLQSDATASASRFKQYLGYSGAIPSTLSASCYINPSAVTPGYYGVFARVKIANTVTNPILTLSVTDPYGNGQAQYSAEYGSTGKRLVVPTTTSLWRWQFLGSVYFGAPEQTSQLLTITGSAGGTGPLGIDVLHVVPMGGLVARRWESGDSPTADGYVPWHNSYNGETAVFSNLRVNAIDQAASYPVSSGAPNGSLMGAAVRLPAGSTSVFWNLTRVMPGLTTVATTSDEDTGAVYTTVLKLNITPRYRFARGS